MVRPVPHTHIYTYLHPHALIQTYAATRTLTLFFLLVSIVFNLHHTSNFPGTDNESDDNLEVPSSSSGSSHNNDDEDSMVNPHDKDHIYEDSYHNDSSNNDDDSNLITYNNYQIRTSRPRLP